MKRGHLGLLALVIFVLVGVVFVILETSEVKASSDTTPPVLTNVSVTPHTLPEDGGSVTIYIEGTDDMSGCEGYQINCRGPKGYSWACGGVFDGTETIDLWEIDQWKPAGIYYIDSITLTDKALNSATYYNATDYSAYVVKKSPNEPPTCSLSASPTSGYAPLDVTLSLSASDTDGSIDSWELDIDNDGSADYSGSSISPATKPHTYQSAGEYTAKFTVTDDDGATDSDTTIITVNETPNQAPTANFDYSPSNPTANTTVNFTDNSTDPDGDIANCTWDFGDGTTGHGQTVNHTYTALGTYNITLTVTDDDGDTDSYIKSVVIKAPSKDEDGTPGFGLALLVMAIAAMLVLKHKK